MNLEYITSRFPESLFSAENAEEYICSLKSGLEIASDINVVITGLCRNISNVLDHSMARLRVTSEFFADCKYLIYENDSDDGTSERLQEYARADRDIILIQENTGHKCLTVEAQDC